MWDKRDTIGRPNESPVNPVYTPDPGKGGRIVNIGPSIMIKGELQGNEDLTIDGQVEGKIELRDHNLTIGPNGKIKADLHANTIVIAGDVQGSVHAKERVEIAPTGRLTGDIASPRITIADGAHFKGSVDMERAETSRKAVAPGKSEEVRRIPEMKDDLKIQGTRL
ncbi:MAG TPA: polymer-forming cytoskeletal protein [Candidatus Polarisedimenticolia bacterium]|jgi:cytoskeletal protein CcmA (bactofilin family)|nr:polymer-forming cytoskeletal protein [Candidatus Polarisedimenticolia bacterium]